MGRNEPVVSIASAGRPAPAFFAVSSAAVAVVFELQPGFLLSRGSAWLFVNFAEPVVDSFAGVGIDPLFFIPPFSF